MKKFIIGILLICMLIPGLAIANDTTFDVTLAWDANTEADLAGYKLYYKTGGPGPAYDGTGATEGASPVDVGNVTEFTVHGLSYNVMHYFVVTAYDNEDPVHESEYSNEVFTDGIIELPPIPPSGTGIMSITVHRPDGTTVTIEIP